MEEVVQTAVAAWVASPLVSRTHGGIPVAAGEEAGHIQELATPGERVADMLVDRADPAVRSKLVIGVGVRLSRPCVPPLQ
jgi:hypothetical protein